MDHAGVLLLDAEILYMIYPWRGSGHHGADGQWHARSHAAVLVPVPIFYFLTQGVLVAQQPAGSHPCSACISAVAESPYALAQHRRDLFSL